MHTITVDVWLYGPLARYGGDPANNVYANVQIDLPEASTLGYLLARLSLPTEERSITFINGDLSAMPGLQPDLDHVLQDGDRVALFHRKTMWPYQYRHGVATTPEFATAMAQGKALFHSADTPVDK